jgi:NAD(P)-dependent dehydrogenase (short-subunit alcohol dehydrogenase family)
MTPESQELRFDGRVAVVTGAHHGMGQSHAVQLARRGARVMVNDLAGAGETVAMITSAGGETVENRSDITTAAGTDQIVAAALERWGRLDILVNNAALNSGTFPDPELAQRTIAVHLMGTVNTIRSAMPVFRQQRYGRIVNTGSGSILGIPQTGLYAAGKGGVLAYTRVLASDLAGERRERPEQDIKVNLLMPAAQTPVMPRVPDERFQHMMDTAFAPANTSPLVLLLAHENCPVSGEAIQTGGGRVSRFILATSEGWQAPDDKPTPESILAHWDEVMAGKDLREPVGTMSDLLGRRGEYPYNVAELFSWSRTGNDPAKAE